MPTSRGVGDDLPAAGDRHDAADRVVRKLHDVVHRPDHPSGAVSCSPIASQVPRERQPGSLQDQPQHADRSDLDRRAGRHPAFIAIPSFQLLTAQYTPPEEPKLTVKATGNQWNWDYEYQTDNTLSFNSAILQDGDRAAAGKEDRKVYPRLLAVDNELVVPVNTMTRVLVTATDVIHSFAMPSFGIKIDAVPGRTNETWFKAEKEGLYLRPVLAALRQGPRLHADRHPRRLRCAVQDLAGGAKTDLPGANKALMAEVDGQNKVAAAGN